MKELFVEKKFSPRSVALIETINEILDDYDAEGYDLSVRQLYYQLVSRNIVPNTEQSYKSIVGLVSDARLAGLIDWGMIKDRGRNTLSNPHWDSPSDFLISVAPQYWFNLWDTQENYLEVMVEKQALEGVLRPVCRAYDVPFTSNKGYSSSSALYEASKRFIEASENGKFCHIIYLGDHDPSGIDMTRDIDERFDTFCGGDVVDVHRIALNMDQVIALNPPKNPAKLTDSRADGYINLYGESSWELDAIEPRRLATLVTTAIEELLDEDEFNRAKAKLATQRQQLLDAARQFENSDDDNDDE